MTSVAPATWNGEMGEFDVELHTSSLHLPQATGCHAKTNDEIDTCMTKHSTGINIFPSPPAEALLSPNTCSHPHNSTTGQSNLDFTNPIFMHNRHNALLPPASDPFHPSTAFTFETQPKDIVPLPLDSTLRYNYVTLLRFLRKRYCISRRNR